MAISHSNIVRFHGLVRDAVNADLWLLLEYTTEEVGERGCVATMLLLLLLLRVWLLCETAGVGGLAGHSVCSLCDVGSTRQNLAHWIAVSSNDPETEAPFHPSWPLRLDIATQIADALRYLHHCSIVHHNVKPSSVRSVGVALGSVFIFFFFEV